MSTKSTIYYDEERDTHLYQDGFDNWNLYLDLPFERHGNVYYETVVIPLALWRQLRQHTGWMERYLDMPLDELRAEAEEKVRERLAKYEAADEKTKWIAATAGCLAFGDIEAPFEEQVHNYILWHTPPVGKEA